MRLASTKIIDLILQPGGRWGPVHSIQVANFIVHSIYTFYFRARVKTWLKWGQRDHTDTGQVHKTVLGITRVKEEEEGNRIMDEELDQKRKSGGLKKKKREQDQQQGDRSRSAKGEVGHRLREKPSLSEENASIIGRSDRWLIDFAT